LRTWSAQGRVAGPEEDHGLHDLQGNLPTRHGPTKVPGNKLTFLYRKYPRALCIVNILGHLPRDMDQQKSQATNFEIKHSLHDDFCTE